MFASKLLASLNRVFCSDPTQHRTSKLVKLGVLEKRQRRPIRGIWQTCLYKLKSWAAWALAGIAGALRKLSNPSHRTVCASTQT